MASRVAKLRELNSRQLAVVLQALILMPLVKAAVRRARFARTADYLARQSAVPRRIVEPVEIAAVARAVSIVANRRFVGEKCLVRSLVLWFLLRRRGIDAVLVIGAPAGMAVGDVAHAWVEFDGAPLEENPGIRDEFPAFELALPRLPT
jgi:hypothetical protein